MFNFDTRAFLMKSQMTVITASFVLNHMTASAEIMFEIAVGFVY